MFSVAVTHNTTGQHDYEGIAQVNTTLFDGQEDATYSDYGEADGVVSDGLFFFDFNVEVNNQPQLTNRTVWLNKNPDNDREVQFSTPAVPFWGTDGSRINANDTDVVHIDLGTLYGLRNNSDGGGHTLFYFIKNFETEAWEPFGSWDVERDTPYMGVFEFESTSGMFVKAPVSRPSPYVRHVGTDWEIELRVRFGTNEQSPVESEIVLTPWTDGGLNGGVGAGM